MTYTVKKRLALVFCVLMLAFAVQITYSPSAEASPTGCNHFIETDGNGYAYCSGGTGQFRVSMGCKGIINFGFGFTQYGDWEIAGQGIPSIAKCPIGSWRWGDYTAIYFR